MLEPVVYREYELLNAPIPGFFNLTHLKAIHDYLYQDIKNPPELKLENEQIFYELREEKFLKDFPVNEFATRLAYYLASLGGDQLATREFIRELALKNNYFLSYAGIKPNQMVRALASAGNQNYKPLTDLILSHLGSF
jgi:cell filamentation protein